MSFVIAGVIFVIAVFRMFVPNSMPTPPQGGTPYRKKKSIRKREKISYQKTIVDLPTTTNSDQLVAKKSSTLESVKTKQPMMSIYQQILDRRRPTPISLASSRTRTKNIPQEIKKTDQRAVSLATLLPPLLRKRGELQKAIVYTDIFGRKYF